MPADSRRRNPFLLAPALVFIILAFAVLTEFVGIGERDGFWIYIIAALVTLVGFGVPAAICFFCRGPAAFAKIRFLKVSKSQAFVLAAGTAVMLLQSSILRLGVLRCADGGSVYELYGFEFTVSVSSVWELLLMLVSLALLPAVCEEIFFRGIAVYEYRFGGVVGSALMTSLLYAVIFLDFGQLPVCFLNGLLLFFIGFLTENLLCPILMHMVYNVFLMFGERYLFILSSGPDSKALFWFLLIALYLASLALLFFAAGRQFRQRAMSSDAPPVRVPRGKRPVVIYDMLSAPPFLADLVCFVVFAVIRLFV